MTDISSIKEKLSKIRAENRNINYENNLLEIQIVKIDSQIEATTKKLQPEKDKIGYESKVESARIDISIEDAAEKRNEAKKALLGKIQQIQNENSTLENEIAMLTCQYNRITRL